MKEKITVLNDDVVAAAVARHEEELAKLRKPTTPEAARAWVDELVKEKSRYDLAEIVPTGTTVGIVSRAMKRGSSAPQPYGFVSTPEGDAFVTPSDMDGLVDGELCAVLTAVGSRGLIADKIVAFEKYFSWHELEIIANAMQAIDKANGEKIRWYGTSDPSDGWPELKAKAKAMGLNLVEIRRCVKSVTYGGRGEDTYIFTEPIRDQQTANEILTNLGGRHADQQTGGYYHGSDDIELTENGFLNRWDGPWTD